jgi:uncharacterized damage-inducible protein DinB
MKMFASAALVLLLASSAAAQTSRTLSAAVTPQLTGITGFVVRAAEKIPEDKYSFRATPEVRTVQELFGHIGDALFGMCAAASGAKPPRTGLEKSLKTKAETVQALKEGVAFCNTAVNGMDDQKGAESVPFYFGPTPRLSILYFVVAHTYEHYGNLVTYMRLNNIVPPSSEAPPPTR